MKIKINKFDCILSSTTYENQKKNKSKRSRSKLEGGSGLILSYAIVSLSSCSNVTSGLCPRGGVCGSVF
jgi:hypothetical protein